MLRGTAPAILGIRVGGHEVDSNDILVSTSRWGQKGAGPREGHRILPGSHVLE